jgi:isopentenyl-diphosphate Delta-isomerase
MDQTSYIHVSPPVAIRMLVEGAWIDGPSIERMRENEMVLDRFDRSLTTATDLELTYGPLTLKGPITIQGHSVKPVGPRGQAMFHDVLNVMRKDQHIAICNRQSIEASGDSFGSGFESMRLPVCSLPELSWNEISTKRLFMGRTFDHPILITGMTGGVANAAVINERLARVANQFNIPMGVGSQRLALKNPDFRATFCLKKKFPNLFLIGNLGVAQLCQSTGIDDALRAIEMIDADALAIHVNVLQELIQVEGDRDFRGAIEHIGRLIEKTKKPILIKEVGVGLDPNTIQKLYAVGVRHFDVGGRGGTSWAAIEGLRSATPRVQRLGETFRNWGLSTAESLGAAVSLGLENCEFVATGGLRDGVSILKALHAGATLAGVGLPFLRAALTSDEAPLELLTTLGDEIKIGLMCSGLTLNK